MEADGSYHRRRPTKEQLPVDAQLSAHFAEQVASAHRGQADRRSEYRCGRGDRTERSSGVDVVIAHENIWVSVGADVDFAGRILEASTNDCAESSQMASQNS
jgi:hypothetical protein